MIENKSKAVPKSRLVRMLKVGGLAGKLMGKAAIRSCVDGLRGKSTQPRELLLSPQNLLEIADRLATMRGAAMKLGQMLSMDAGTILSPQLASIFSQLQSNGYRMPKRQLSDTLADNWGKDWNKRFFHFEWTPFAAASIGQVHRGFLHNGDCLAVKVQFPGVLETIDSDLDNVLFLLRLTGLVPAQLDISPLIEEARIQLKQEVDYLSEAHSMIMFKSLLSKKPWSDWFEVPNCNEEFTTKQILCAPYIDCHSLEQFLSLKPSKANDIFERLFRLFFAELFHFNYVQTDPNVANYLVSADEKVVLLDFGAVRHYDTDFSVRYKRALSYALSGQRQSVQEAIEALGFDLNENNVSTFMEMFWVATEPLRHRGRYDFGQCGIGRWLLNKGLKVRHDPISWHAPPPEVIFLHRKIVGLYWLASRYGACIDIRSICSEYLDPS